MLYGASRWRPRPGTAPTRRNLEVFAATLVLGRKAAAGALGLSESTVRLHVGDLYTRLGVASRWEAAAALGWLTIPSELLPRGVPVSLGSTTTRGGGAP